jgi:hypothetical protein
MTVIRIRPRAGRSTLAVALLLALLAHLAVMASPVHVRAMVELDLAHHHSIGVPSHLDAPEGPLPLDPVFPHWDACGFAAALPVAELGFGALSGVLPGCEALRVSFDSMMPSFARSPDPPPPMNRQALLQVFRL